MAHELLNPGVQEVIDELTSSLRGQQIYLTPYDTSKPAPFSEVAVRCSAAGHIAIGLRRGGQPHLNVSASFQVEPQDTLITIGKQRLTLS